MSQSSSAQLYYLQPGGPSDGEEQSLSTWQRARQSLLAERPHVLLWVPVLLALGAGGYFLLPQEPPLTLGLATLAVALAGSKVWPLGRYVCLAVVFLALGFVAADLKASWKSQPLIAEEMRAISLLATVEKVEERENGSTRLYLRDLSATQGEQNLPDQVRLTVRTQLDDGLSSGTRVSLRAVLRPLPRPVMPGSYDYGRQLYFQGLGGTGFAVSPVRAVGDMPGGADASLISRIRARIATSIETHLDGQSAALAKTLLIGDRSAISDQVRDDFRNAGLAHLLAISGLHMALVTGCIFLVLRRGLSLIPGLATRYPLKAWAAGLSIFATLGYLALVGAPISAQRAAMMTVLVMLAIIVGRQAISLRTAALAATVMLLFWPENILNISFQMSFTAVICLIAGFQAIRGWMTRMRHDVGGLRGAAIVYGLGICLSTVIAEIALLPLSLYHFHAVSFYGLAGNAVAVPLTAAFIMPFGLAAVFLEPFGLAGLALTPMGWALDVLLKVAADVGRAPGALQTFGTIPFVSLLLIYLGGGWLIIWSQAWRWAGLAVIAIAPVFVLLDKPPDILVNESGALIAVRGPDDRLYFNKRTASSFVRDNWVGARGQVETPLWATKSVDDIAACDALGCRVLLAAGDGESFKAIARARWPDWKNAPGLIALETIRHPGALQDACRSGTIIVTRLNVKGRCEAADLVADQAYLKENGPITMRLSVHSNAQATFKVATTKRDSRPWHSNFLTKASKTIETPQ